METAIVKRSDEPGSTCRGIVRVGDMDGLWRFAGCLIKSRCCPDSWKDQETAFIALQAGSEAGLSLMQTAKSVYVVGNRPALYDDAPLALCMASEVFDHSKFEETWDEKAQVATVTVCRKGGKPVTRTFGMADANRAGLPKRNPNYHTYPQRMCLRRARSWALRDTFPDVLMGLSIKEDIEDYVDVQASPVPEQKPSLAESLKAQQSESQEPEQSAPADEGDKPKRGRPKGSKNKPPAEPEEQPEDASADNQAQEPDAGDPLAPSEDPAVVEKLKNEKVESIRSLATQVGAKGGNAAEIIQKYGVKKDVKPVGACSMDELVEMEKELSEKLAELMKAPQGGDIFGD